MITAAYILFICLSFTQETCSLNLNNNVLTIDKFKKLILTGGMSLSIIGGNYNIHDRNSGFTLTSISHADDYKLDSEALDLIRKARQIESDSTDLKMAQTLYEQVVVAYPDYAIGMTLVCNFI